MLVKRGFITPKKPELNNLNTFSVMEAIIPLAINHDDPFQPAMAFTQNRTTSNVGYKSMPALITTGADEALPYSFLISLHINAHLKDGQ